MAEHYVPRFENVGIKDIAEVGGKNASLGEMIQSFAADGIRVPDGFATTATAYRAFLDGGNLAPEIKARIDSHHRGASVSQTPASPASRRPS